jgi:hypothetical protein
MLGIIILLLVLLGTPAFATTYYVSPSGTGTNCTDAQDPSTPHNTIAEGVACLANGSADILYLRSGTYTTSINLITGSKAGSGTNYLTIAAFPGETATIAPTSGMLIVSSVNHHFIIDGLVFDGVNLNANTYGTSNGGIHLQNAYEYTIKNVTTKRMKYNGLYLQGFTNVKIQNVHSHDQVSQCATTGTHRFYGLYAFSGSTLLVEHSTFNGNPGGGIHLNTSTGSGGGPLAGVIIRHNKVYENNYCGGTVSPFGGIIAYSGGASAGITGLQIYENEVYGNGTTNETIAGGIIISNLVANSKVFNNTVYNNRGYGIAIMTVASNGHLVANNITLGNLSNNLIRGEVADATFTTNRDTGSISDYVTNAAAGDFTLKAGSAAIGAGTAQTDFIYSGTTDQGAHDAWTCTSATIDTNVMDINCNTKDVPVIPSSSITGFSVNCTGTGCGSGWTVVAERKSGSDAVIRLTISGITGNACAAGQTWTWSYTPGNLTNSAYIGEDDDPANQGLLAASSQAVTNVCTGTPTTPPASGLHVHYKMDEAAGAGTAQDETANNLDGTWTNSPSVTTGKTGNALSFPDGSTEVYLAVPYGSGLNPSSSSLSICLGVLPHNAAAAQKIWFSADNGTNQRFYFGQVGGTIGIGIQSTGFTTGSEFPVVAEWTRVCLVADAGTDTATLYVNGVKGASSQVVKSYTSFTLASNFKVGVGTFSVNYGGSTADDLKIYAATALTDQEVLDDYTAWNPVTPDPTGTYTQVGHQWQLLRKKTDLSAENYGAASATMPVVVGGAVTLVTQVDCTTGNCDPTGLRLYYSCASCDTAGEWLPVPDSAGSDGVSFYGATGDQDIVSGTVECCLSGALTENDGSTQFTASAIPNVDLTQNSSFVRRSVLRFTSSVTAGRTYCFQEYHQTGVALATPTPSGGACVTISSMAAGVGF